MFYPEVFRQHSLLFVLFYMFPIKDNMIDCALTGGKTVFGLHHQIGLPYDGLTV